MPNRSEILPELFLGHTETYKSAKLPLLKRSYFWSTPSAMPTHFLENVISPPKCIAEQKREGPLKALGISAKEVKIKTGAPLLDLDCPNY